MVKFRERYVGVAGSTRVRNQFFVVVVVVCLCVCVCVCVCVLLSSSDCPFFWRSS